MSIKLAIEKLGVGKCYHMHEVFLNPEDVAIWKVAYENRDEVDWPALLSGYVATLDGPACLFWRELADAFPDASVLLVIRDPADWYRSFMSTIYRVVASNQAETAIQLIQYQFLDGFFEGRIEEEAFAIKKYRQYLDDVRCHISADRLVEYRVSDGWKPLCELFHVATPDELFPVTNTRETFATRNRLNGTGAEGR
jgi:hypothetical protein